MNSIKILACGAALPKAEINNEELNKKFNLSENWIEKRTGIQKRYYAKEETLTSLTTEATKDALKKAGIDKEKIGMIVVATTSTEKLMPGIAFEIQKNLDIKRCICMDILCGCSGYINGFDIIRKYIALGEIEYGVVIGAEVLSKYTDENDINTRILLADGAGATLIGKSEEKKAYFQNIVSEGQMGEILTCYYGENIYMDGKKVYRFGTTKTVEYTKELLESANEDIENIKYLIPHQSNLKMMKNICEKLGISEDKMYTNIDRVGNTFNASIPIALNEMIDSNLLIRGDKIVLLGYGGGLNLGVILLEY